DGDLEANLNLQKEPSALESNVRFNVGGRVYEVARSTVEQYPDTMLARMIDTTWKHEHYKPGDMIYIDRNGNRFQYVLDYMRDGTVHLPVTECYAAIAHELDYFGFENVGPKKVVQGTLEGGRIMTSISGNVSEELDSIDKDIQDLETKIKSSKNQKHAIRAAHILFMRAANVPDELDRFQITIQDSDDKDTFGNATRHARGFLKERLGVYGLELVKYPNTYISSLEPKVKITLKRVPAPQT
ncbi:MAG: hypothetical protein SGILL_004827, partial [Bacillariaceae sp.]